jgi:hypothetical protein
MTIGDRSSRRFEEYRLLKGFLRSVLSDFPVESIEIAESHLSDLSRKGTTLSLATTSSSPRDQKTKRRMILIVVRPNTNHTTHSSHNTFVF